MDSSVPFHMLSLPALARAPPVFTHMVLRPRDVRELLPPTTQGEGHRLLSCMQQPRGYLPL